MSPFKLNSSRIILLIFIILGIVTIGATIITNFGMWGNYDRIEAEQGIAPADAIPLPKPLPGQEAPAP
ncbi:hypothetical protein [uncultured Devosia sp.]|uniref:hypothetical protein n=1 Tax=uncultured Devosia sp. TaxID=211434 RepID=UPI0035CB7939